MIIIIVYLIVGFIFKSAGWQTITIKQNVDMWDIQWKFQLDQIQNCRPMPTFAWLYVGLIIYWKTLPDI